MTILLIIGVLLFVSVAMLAISAVVMPVVNWLSHWSTPASASQPQFESVAEYIVPFDLQWQLDAIVDAACAAKGKPYRKLGLLAQSEIDARRKQALDSYLHQHHSGMQKRDRRRLRQRLFYQASLLDEYRDLPIV